MGIFKHLAMATPKSVSIRSFLLVLPVHMYSKALEFCALFPQDDDVNDVLRRFSTRFAGSFLETDNR